MEKPPDYGMSTVLGYGSHTIDFNTGCIGPRQVCGRMLNEVWRSRNARNPKIRLFDKKFGISMHKKNGDLGVVNCPILVFLIWFWFGNENMVWFVHHIQKKEIYFATGMVHSAAVAKENGNDIILTGSDASTVGAVDSPQSIDGRPTRRVKILVRKELKI